MWARMTKQRHGRRIAGRAVMILRNTAVTGAWCGWGVSTEGVHGYMHAAYDPSC
jgi:hypothetical protein